VKFSRRPSILAQDVTSCAVCGHGLQAQPFPQVDFRQRRLRLAPSTARNSPSEPSKKACATQPLGRSKGSPAQVRLTNFGGHRWADRYASSAPSIAVRGAGSARSDEACSARSTHQAARRRKSRKPDFNTCTECIRLCDLLSQRLRGEAFFDGFGEGEFRAVDAQAVGDVVENRLARAHAQHDSNVLRQILWPSRRISPSRRALRTVSYIRLSVRIRVDLPQPEGPMSAVTLFVAIPRVMSKRVCLLP